MESRDELRAWLPNPPLALWMLYRSWQEAAETPKQKSNWGILGLGLGSLFYALALRSQQPRLAIAGLPFLLLGIIWCYWGELIDGLTYNSVLIFRHH